MALISILLAVFIERFLGSWEELRRYGWFASVVQAARSFGFGEGSIGVLLALAVPLLGFVMFDHLLAALWWPLSFLFGLLVLLYCLGPRDLEAEVESFLDARERDDEESAMLHASDLLRGIEIGGSRQLTRALLETIFAQASERVLAVMFWFVVLGPAGALLYRLTTVMSAAAAGEDSEFAAAARRLHHLLAWLPARLVALGYALSGSFVDAMHQWRSEAGGWEVPAQHLLAASGMGALRYRPPADEETPVDVHEEDSYVREALALARRAALIWLAVLALLTLAGWIG